MSGYERRRNLVVRPDGRLVNVARFRGHLFVCHDNCCCGRTEDGIAPVPVDVYHAEWERRRLRNIVHLTIGGCLGPCALANVVLLQFDGQALWFHSMGSDAQVLALYDYIESMLDADRLLPPPRALAPYQFTASQSEDRPDGQPVDDYRPRRRGTPPPIDECATEHDGDERAKGEARGVIAGMTGPAAMPRRNGELVFDAPWQGRAFGMAVALHEQGLYEWDTFRDALVAHVARAEQSGGTFDYYACWLGAFEQVLGGTGVTSPAEIEERTYEFEYGERDDVF